MELIPGTEICFSSRLPGDSGLPIFPLGIPAAGSNSQTTGRPRIDGILALFDELRPSLLRYLLNRRVSIESAEEIIQEAFLELFRRVRTGKAIDQPRAWIFGVAHNLAMRHHRSARLESATPLESLPGASSAVADSRPTPEDALAAIQRDKRLSEALQELSDIERQCLDLRAEGLSYREIAEALGSATSTVGDHVRRAIAFLRRACEF